MSSVRRSPPVPCRQRACLQSHAPRCPAHTLRCVGLQGSCIMAALESAELPPGALTESHLSLRTVKGHERHGQFAVNGDLPRVPRPGAHRAGCNPRRRPAGPRHSAGAGQPAAPALRGSESARRTSTVSLETGLILRKDALVHRMCSTWMGLKISAPVTTSIPI